MFGIIFLHTIRDLFQTPRWWRKIILGGALNLLPALVLFLSNTGQIGVEVEIGLLIVTFGLSLIVWGYLYRIFVDALNGTESLILSSWDNWWAYGAAGFWLFLIALGYGVIVIVGLSMVISILGLETLWPLLMLAIVFCYGFFPVVFMRFAAEGRVWMTFEPGPVWRGLRQIVRGDYVQACLGLFGITLLGSLILGNVPWVGLALASVFYFLVMVVFARVLGLLIRRALGPGAPSSRSVDRHWN